jgi:hypothetical protein
MFIFPSISMFSSFQPYQDNIHATLKSFRAFLISRKRLIAILSAIVGVIILLSAVISYTPKYIASTLKKPVLTKSPPEITNQDIAFEAKENIVAYYQDRPYWPAPKYQNQYNFERIEGTHTFKFYTYKEVFGFGKIKSNEFTEVTVTGDYTSPTFADLETKKAYPKKEDSFSFTTKEKDLIVKNGDEIMFDPANTENKCKQEAQDQVFKLTCPIIFGDKKELTLNYTLTDKAGNTTKVTDNLLLKNVELPTFECTKPPEITNKNTADVTCKTNKTGSIKDVNGEVAKAEKDKPIPIKLTLKEGENKFNYTFTDEDGFDAAVEIKVTSDTKAPTVDFTFLDTKKKFNEGSFTLKFKPSETAEAKVVVRAYNETFENDPRFKEPLLAKTWGYKGGSNYMKTVIGGEEAVFTTPNDMGGCQIYDTLVPAKKLVETPQGFCAFYNVFFIKTDITLSDKAGNSSQYQCTSYTWDENKNPAGDLPTECKKL